MSKVSKSATENARLADARRRALISLEDISDDEDRAITADAVADPDAQPADELFRRKIGRPRSPNKKLSVLLRLDPEVVALFKADGEGWQTRMNDALRKAAGLDR